MSGGFRRALTIAFCLATLVPLRMADAWLSTPPRARDNYVNDLQKRLKRRSHAQIAMMGQSTIGKWLVDGERFAKLFKLDKSDVVGAQIGGCDFTCSYAQARQMIAQGHHWKQLYYGANLYQMCEDPWSWRVATPLALMPWTDLPKLFALWSHARKPLSYYGRSLGMGIAEAYQDSLAAHNHLFRAFDIDPKLSATRVAAQWARPTALSAGWAPTCDYAPEAVALKREAVRRLAPELARLADHVFYMVLPDRSHSDPKYRDVWPRFVADQRALVSDAPRTTFLDLVTEGTDAYGDFVDGAHLGPHGMDKQSALLKRKLAELQVHVP